MAKPNPRGASSVTGRRGARRPTGERTHGLARVLSKLGVCSRTQAAEWVRAGRVRVNGSIVLDPERPTDTTSDRISVDNAPIGAVERVYVAMNKPRGLVSTARDECGRDTVYRLLDGAGLPWIAPVGRLDRASEGLLLFSNDPAWSARLTDPDSHVPRTYHVQVDRVPDAALVDALRRGATCDGEVLKACAAMVLRAGGKHGWIEIVLDEGRNRHIRRLLAALDTDVLRLVRVAIGPLLLGDLAKGAWRRLEAREVRELSTPPTDAQSRRIGARAQDNGDAAE